MMILGEALIDREPGSVYDYNFWEALALVLCVILILDLELILTMVIYSCDTDHDPLRDHAHRFDRFHLLHGFLSVVAILAVVVSDYNFMNNVKYILITRRPNC